MHAQTKHYLAHLQDLIPNSADLLCLLNFIPAKVGIKSYRCARECYVTICIWLGVIIVANPGYYFL